VAPRSTSESAAKDCGRRAHGFGDTGDMWAPLAAALMRDQACLASLSQEFLPPCSCRQARQKQSASTVRVATGTMGFKHKALDLETVRASLVKPNYLLKIIPHVDGSPRICELVDYRLEDIVMKGAWTGPATLDLRPHALAPIAELPVREIISATHIMADLTLGLGKVVYDYLEA